MLNMVGGYGQRTHFNTLQTIYVFTSQHIRIETASYSIIQRYIGIDTICEPF